MSIAGGVGDAASRYSAGGRAHRSGAGSGAGSCLPAPGPTVRRSRTEPRRLRLRQTPLLPPATDFLDRIFRTSCSSSVRLIGHLLIGRSHETGRSTCCYTDGIPGVDPCRSLHGIITVLRRFAPTADRLHRNAPFVHSIAKSGIGRRDPATVQHGGALRSRHGPRPRSAASGAGAGRASGLSRPCAIVTLFMKRRALEKVLRERGWNSCAMVDDTTSGLMAGWKKRRRGTPRSTNGWRGPFSGA